MVKKLFIIIVFLGVFSLMPRIVLAQELGETACNATIPTESLNLYKVDTTQSSATIFFNEPTDNVTGYTVSYGFTQDATGYTQQFIAQPYNGVVMFTLTNLAPDATFYFKVRSENGCAHGPWSAIRQSGYPNSKGLRLPTTADESYSMVWIGVGGVVVAALGLIALVF